jgi:hypothetical protein
VKILPVGDGLSARKFREYCAAWFKDESSIDKLAVSLALGFVLGVFPVFGFPTILCGAAAAVWRLNFPTLQIDELGDVPAANRAAMAFCAVRRSAVWCLAWITGLSRSRRDCSPYDCGMAMLRGARRADGLFGAAPATAMAEQSPFVSPASCQYESFLLY